MSQQADGWLDLHSRPDSTGHQCLNLSSSNDQSVQGRTPRSLIKEITSIDVSTAAVRHILLKTAHNQGKHSLDKLPTPTPRIRAKGRLCKSVKEE
jgi:hypothetical protein